MDAVTSPGSSGTAAATSSAAAALQQQRGPEARRRPRPERGPKQDRSRATRQRLRGTKGFSEADQALAAAIEAVRALEIPHLDFDDAVDGEVIH